MKNFILCLVILVLVEGNPSNYTLDAFNEDIQLNLTTILPVSSDFYFGHIADMTLLPDGSIIVLDSDKQKILKFNHEGTLLTTIAREGNGPGEIAGAYDNYLASGNEGKIAVFDQNNFRITFWNKKGEYIRDYRLSGGWGVSLEWGSSGKVIYRRHPFRPDKHGNKIIKYSGINPATGEITKLGSVPILEGYEAKYTCVFCSWTLSEENTIITARYDTSYTFYELTTNGKKIKQWNRKGILPVQYSDRELEQIKYNRGNSRISYSETAPLPTFKDRFKDFETDTQGRIWAQVSAPDGLSTFDIFNKKGVFLQRITIEKELQMLEIKEGYLLARLEGQQKMPKAFLYKILEK